MLNRLVLTLFVSLVSLFLAVPVLVTGSKAQAGSEIGSVTNMPLPRFVSLRSDTVYVRAGPGMRFPVKWAYQRRGYPLQVVQEFDTWRKIKDAEGDEGWVHQSLLSGNRHVLVQGAEVITIYKKPDNQARPVAQIEPGVVAKLNECEDTWCEVSVSGYDGWLLKSSLWGVYEHEESE
jgi:SH3-like domain-containing protein